MSFLKLIPFLLLLAMFSCESADKTTKDSNKNNSVSSNRKTKDKRYKTSPLISSYDVNRDGTADMWKIYKEFKAKDDLVKKILLRREIDLNFDGKINYYKFYTEKGDIDKEYIDLNLDGVVETIVFYERNIIKKQFKYKKNPIKEDLTIDESIPVYKKILYANKKLDRVIVDRTDDGVLDQYLFFKKNKLIQIAFDDDEDGKIDTRVRMKEKLAPKKELSNTKKDENNDE